VTILDAHNLNFGLVRTVYSIKALGLGRRAKFVKECEPFS